MDFFSWFTEAGVIVRSLSRKFSRVFRPSASFDSAAANPHISRSSLQKLLPSQELLPGIPDDITISHIATKFPWSTCSSMILVSRNWQQAIQDRHIYDARVLHGSRETLVVIKHQDSEDATAISLYSMREKTVYQVPPIPQLEGRIPWFSQFHSSNGNLYVRGDVKRGFWPRDDCMDSQSIYVLDLGGQRQWKESTFNPQPDLLKYNVDQCNIIACALRIGDDFYIRGGCEDWFESSWFVTSIETPGEWRAVSPLKFLVIESCPEKFFFTPENTYEIRDGVIYASNTATDDDSESIRLQHSKISCDELGPIDYVTIHPLFVLPVNNELLAIVRWITEVSHGCCLLQSKGFGSQSADIEWEKGPDCFHFNTRTSLAMCPIRL